MLEIVPDCGGTIGKPIASITPEDLLKREQVTHSPKPIQPKLGAPYGSAHRGFTNL